MPCAQLWPGVVPGDVIGHVADHPQMADGLIVNGSPLALRRTRKGMPMFESCDGTRLIRIELDGNADPPGERAGWLEALADSLAAETVDADSGARAFAIAWVGDMQAMGTAGRLLRARALFDVVPSAQAGAPAGLRVHFSWHLGRGTWTGFTATVLDGDDLLRRLRR